MAGLHNHNGDVLIIGVDPATARGKLMAMALVRFRRADDRFVLSMLEERVTERYVHDRIMTWRATLLGFLDAALEIGRPDMVAIEDARPRGRGGANVQHLVQTLKEAARSLGLRVELIPPGTAKKHATGRGNAHAAEVAVRVQAEYKGMEGLSIITGEYDLEAAVAIAGAGYALLQEEWLREQAQ